MQQRRPGAVPWLQPPGEARCRQTGGQCARRLPGPAVASAAAATAIGLLRLLLLLHGLLLLLLLLLVVAAPGPGCCGLPLLKALPRPCRLCCHPCRPLAVAAAGLGRWPCLLPVLRCVPLRSMSALRLRRWRGRGGKAISRGALAGLCRRCTIRVPDSLLPSTRKATVPGGSGASACAVTSTV